ncbi:hypothetical protein D3C86_911580 [compost metagenome]
MRKQRAWFWSLTAALWAPLSGCALVAVGGLFSPTTPLSERDAEPPKRALTVRGVLKAPLNLVAQGALADAPALTATQPFASAAPLSRVQALPSFRILALPGDATPGQERWNADGTVRHAAVELIDPATGEVVGSGHTDEMGRFVIATFTRGAGPAGFIAQAILRNAKGQTAGLLAAPFGAAVVSVPTKKEGIEVSAGTTLLTFSSLFLSNAYPSVDLSKGFSGVSSPRLGQLVSGLPNQQVQTTSGVLNRGTLITGARSFDEVLNNLVTSGAVLSFQVDKLGKRAASASVSTEQEVGLHSAVLTQLLETIVAVDDQQAASGAPATQDLFEEAAGQVNLEAVKQKADEIARHIAPSSMPTLPPIPTPTPGNVGVELR